MLPSTHLVETLDLTALDVLRKNPRYLTRAKSIDTFFSFGPVVVTADEGIRLLDLHPSQIHVAHNGVSAEFSPRPSGEADDPPYVLLVSEYSARKRYSDAFARVSG